MTTTTSITQRAEEARAYFTRKVRQDGTDAPFWATKDPPEWVVDLCRAAHDGGQIWPDDHRYALIVDALDAITEGGEDDDPREYLAEEVYTSNLTAWLASHVTRVCYLDQALADYGPMTEGFRLLATAYRLEQEEVLDAVVRFLEEVSA